MIIHNKYFNIKQIADSGQCFRMNQISDTKNRLHYSLIAYGRYLELIQLEEDAVEMSCTEDEYHQVWKEYFDLNYDYGRIVEQLSAGDDLFLKEAADYGYGIRILKQEPFEAVISFIISQNKNIPAIKSCIELICKNFGEKIYRDGIETEHYSFPTPASLSKAGPEELRALKTGYRDEYIIKAACAVTEGELDLRHLQKCSFEDSVKALQQFRGIGEKVANCIALYGLHQIDGFPVDIWMKRVLKDYYNNKFEKERFKGYAGIIQQYMFYYIRHLHGNRYHVKH